MCSALLYCLQSLQLSGLRVLSSLAAGICEGEVSGEVLVTTQLLDRLLHLIRDTHTPQEVRPGNLHTICQCVPMHLVGQQLPTKGDLLHSERSVANVITSCK